MDELKDLDRIKNKLQQVYPKLMDLCATEAVNFFKERFVKGKDIFDKRFKKRKGDNKKEAGRAILVKSGALKRDIQKIEVTAGYAIVGTTRITSPYARANNEGFKGKVNVPEHTRQRFKKVKESYTDRNGKSRARTSKQVADGEPVKVKAYVMRMNLPKRQFLGSSPLLNKRVQGVVTRRIKEELQEFKQ